MNTETMIKSSTWWQLARQMPDRHHDPSSGISIADHLEATHNNLRALLRPNPSHPFLVALHRALVDAGLELEELMEMLTPVTLLHDIGKVREVDHRGPHPSTDASSQMRHPALSVIAAEEILPPPCPAARPCSP